MLNASDQASQIPTVAGAKALADDGVNRGSGKSYFRSALYMSTSVECAATITHTLHVTLVHLSEAGSLKREHSCGSLCFTHWTEKSAKGRIVKTTAITAHI